MKTTKAERAAIIISVIFIISAVSVVAVRGAEKSHRTVSSVQTQPSAVQEADDNAASGLININTASAEQLCTLPGIGEALAERIIEYREENGAYTDTSDIIDVSGIGLATYDGIKDKITA